VDPWPWDAKPTPTALLNGAIRIHFDRDKQTAWCYVLEDIALLSHLPTGEKLLRLLMNRHRATSGGPAVDLGDVAERLMKGQGWDANMARNLFGDPLRGAFAGSFFVDIYTSHPDPRMRATVAGSREMASTMPGTVMVGLANDPAIVTSNSTNAWLMATSPKVMQVKSEPGVIYKGPPIDAAGKRLPDAESVPVTDAVSQQFVGLGVSSSVVFDVFNEYWAQFPRPIRVLALGHELIHAWHYMSGRGATWIPYLNGVPDGRWKWSEEFTTIVRDAFSPADEAVTENMLREDLNRAYGYAIPPRRGVSQLEFERGLPPR
jgi:hypothetical protein